MVFLRSNLVDIFIEQICPVVVTFARQLGTMSRHSPAIYAFYIKVL